MARLVPATCPSCGAGIRLDPDDEIVTCELCHTSSFVQTRHRPEPSASDPRYTAVIEVEPPRPRLVVAAAVAGALVMGVLGIFLFAQPPPPASVASPAPAAPERSRT